MSCTFTDKDAGLLYFYLHVNHIWTCDCYSVRSGVFLFAKYNINRFEALKSPHSGLWCLEQSCLWRPWRMFAAVWSSALMSGASCCNFWDSPSLWTRCFPVKHVLTCSMFVHFHFCQHVHQQTTQHLKYTAEHRTHSWIKTFQCRIDCVYDGFYVSRQKLIVFSCSACFIFTLFHIQWSLLLCFGVLWLTETHTWLKTLVTAFTALSLSHIWYNIFNASHTVWITGIHPEILVCKCL